jgi:hypothetical protein
MPFGQKKEKSLGKRKKRWYLILQDSIPYNIAILVR